MLKIRWGVTLHTAMFSGTWLRLLTLPLMLEFQRAMCPWYRKATAPLSSWKVFRFTLFMASSPWSARAEKSRLTIEFLWLPVMFPHHEGRFGPGRGGLGRCV